MSILAAIGAGLSGLSSFLGYKGQQSANRTNLKLAEQARQHDISMWNAQNAYNSPQMQMQRMKEAGLNPNLIYGSGGAETTAASPQKAPVPSVDNEMVSLAQMSLTPMISLYQDWQVKKAQIDNLAAEQASKESLTRLNNLKYSKEVIGEPYWATERGFEYDKKRLGLNIQEQQLFQNNLKTKYQTSSYPALLNQISLRNAVLEQTRVSQQLENELSRNLKPYGLTSRDNVWARILLNLGNNPKIKPLFNLFSK